MMVDPKKQAELDQALESVKILPQMWWNHYKGCIDVGFDPATSLILTRDYLHATITKPSDSEPSDEP